jgi:hypothetical protein
MIAPRDQSIQRIVLVLTIDGIDDFAMLGRVVPAKAGTQRAMLSRQSGIHFLKRERPAALDYRFRGNGESPI